MRPSQILMISVILTTAVSSSTFATSVTYTCPDASAIVLGPPMPVVMYDTTKKRRVLTIRWRLTGFLTKQVDGERRIEIMPLWSYINTYASEEKVNIKAPPIVPTLSNPVTAYFVSRDDAIACKYQYGPMQSLYFGTEDPVTLYGHLVGNCPDTQTGQSIQCTLS